MTLKYIWWGKQQRKEDTLKVVELYMKSHPNVKIITEDYSGADDVAAQLAVETADQDTADIIQGDYEFIFNYINRDLVEPLNPYIKNKLLSTTDISPDTLAPGMKNKELYAVNIAMNSEAVLYDPELFEEAGITVPAEDYTIDDLHATLVQLKQSITTPDFYPLGNMLNVNYYLRSRGVKMYNADGTGLGYDDDKILADYFTLYKKWVDEGLLSKDSLKDWPIDENHPLITGKSAFYFGFSNHTTALSKIAGHAIHLLPFPQISKEAEGRFIKPSMFLMASSYSKHPEEAVKFIDFFVNNVEANNILKGERGVPVSKVISSGLSAKVDEAGKEQYKLLDYLKTHSSPIDPPSPGNAVVLKNALQLILSHVIDGTTTPESGAKEYRIQAIDTLQGTKEEPAK
ncbi:ABC transporter substrate-binding protein [Paenibacillus sp. 22594]|uniref:ABC transporter substrate-binding protein n=1 Tax=Paenibacillus sp. 22594 TaxID=3453947 RepID=UPI003F8789B8